MGAGALAQTAAQTAVSTGIYTDYKHMKGLVVFHKHIFKHTTALIENFMCHFEKMSVLTPVENSGNIFIDNFLLLVYILWIFLWNTNNNN